MGRRRGEQGGKSDEKRSPIRAHLAFTKNEEAKKKNRKFVTINQSKRMRMEEMARSESSRPIKTTFSEGQLAPSSPTFPLVSLSPSHLTMLNQLTLSGGTCSIKPKLLHHRFAECVFCINKYAEIR